MTDLLRPLLDPQPLLRGRNTEDTARIVWRRHVLHHLGCWPPVVIACLVAPWLAPAVWWRATEQHREDWRRALQSVHDATDR